MKKGMAIAKEEDGDRNSIHNGLVHLSQVVIKIEPFNYSTLLFLLVVLSGFVMLILTFYAFHSVNLELACFK